MKRANTPKPAQHTAAESKVNRRRAGKTFHVFSCYNSADLLIDNYNYPGIFVGAQIQLKQVPQIYC